MSQEIEVDYEIVDDDEAPVFWMIWSPQGAMPEVKHFTYREAEEEAERLAKKHPGRRFYIMYSCELVKTEQIIKHYGMDKPE